MRVYGSSPLYNYVELVFRAKKLFIIAVVIGVLISGAMAYTRAGMYTGTAILFLSGYGPTSSGSEHNFSMVSPNNVASKLEILNIVTKDPNFWNSVIRDRGIDKRYPKMSLTALRQEVRKSFSFTRDPEGNLLEITCQWKDPSGLIDLINSFYTLFVSKVVNYETASDTTDRMVLESNYRDYNAKMQRIESEKRQYLAQHFWEQPSFIGANIGNLQSDLSAQRQQKASLKMLQSRLAVINKQLSVVPKQIDIQYVERQNPQIASLQSQLTTLQQSKNQLLQIYTPINPKVVAVQQQINFVQQQLKQAASPSQSSTNPSERTYQYNPQWQSLKQAQSDTLQDVATVQESLNNLSGQIVKDQAKVKAVPMEEKQLLNIDRDYSLIASIRNNLRSRMEIARINERTDRILHAKSISMAVSPQAEPINARGKALLLVLLGPILGLIIAFCFALGAEALDHSLRTPVEVEKYLGKPVLAVIPKIQSEQPERKRLPGATKPSISS